MPESHSQNFNHLKIHTQYSICEGAARIDDLQEYSKKNKIKTLGLCDTSHWCGALEFAEKISKSGTQPISGTQIYVVHYNLLKKSQSQAHNQLLEPKLILKLEKHQVYFLCLL